MLQWLLTGGLIPPLLMVCGLFFVFYLGCLPFRSPKKMWRALRTPAADGGVSPFRAVMLALAGTLGVGNIVGVASAIRIGGAGAIFWMWVSALVATVLKYAEILLAVAHRREGSHGFIGGAYYYIKDHFLSRNRWRAATLISGVFAVLMIVNALSMGCVIQVNAVASALEGVLKIPPYLTGLILLCLILPVAIRGTRGISSLTELLVPIMTLGYLILSATVLILRREAVGDAFLSIFRGAFSMESMGGGLVGFLTSRALRVGTMRGLLSNEAGCGTAPTAHASAHTVSPSAQGVWGIFEVFVDTILLCTVTALVILVGFPHAELFENDAVMTAIRAYSTVLGGWSEWFFSAAVFCFGYATVLCWASYGLEALAFLSRKPIWRIFYFAAFAACIPVGAVAAPDGIWGISDFAIAALTAINLCILFSMRREIRRETLAYFGK
ncbi:MAG: sodium:alanine symporter family protein [Clostridia bacterium]|nr:sodium:alanine symporter family protein [Clostridia bacterium]